MKSLVCFSIVVVLLLSQSVATSSAHGRDDNEDGHVLKKPLSRFLGKYVKHDDLSLFQTTPRKLGIYVRKRSGGGVRPIGTGTGSATRSSSSSSPSTRYHCGFFLSILLSFGVFLMVV